MNTAPIVVRILKRRSTRNDNLSDNRDRYSGWRERAGCKFNLGRVNILRLWHYKLIPYLPRQQLLSQWRECCCIAKSITEKGTPNHILVNRIMDYTIFDFVHYSKLVYFEMCKRKYNVNWQKFAQYFPLYIGVPYWTTEDLFKDWHNDVYLRQCLYNLEEKAICNGVPADEWQRIYDRFKDFTPLQEIK